MKRICCLAAGAALVLGLSGCSWMNGSYMTVTPHQIGLTQTDDDLFVVSNYSQLRAALIGLIDSGGENALISLVDYPAGQLIADVESAISYAAEVYPVGAYAVDSIHYDHGTSNGQEEISVDVSYRRSKADIDQIHNVRGISGAKDAIAHALEEYQRSLVLQITGYADTDFLQFIEDYSALHPDTVMEQPRVTTQIYPREGSVRIVELQFSYQTSRESLRYMHGQVTPIFSSAELYVSRDAGDTTKLSQLYNFLMQRFDYSVESSITPSYSLLCYGVGDSRAFANVYAAMCRRVGLEAVTVSGTCQGESRVWNIVRSEDSCYHVDLLRCYLTGQFDLCTDEEMDGYVWDYSAYPPCGRPLEEPLSRP